MTASSNMDLLLTLSKDAPRNLGWFDKLTMSGLKYGQERPSYLPSLI